MKRSSAFWEFVRERETIRLRRLEGQDPPWSDDFVFRSYSFTNVKREHDRVSRQLDDLFYRPRRESGELKHPSKIALLNAAIFRFHGTTDSAERIGWHDSWSLSDSAEMSSSDEIAMSNGYKIFTAAYVVPTSGYSVKADAVAAVVTDVWEVADDVLSFPNWSQMSRVLQTIKNVGSFMSKEVLLDYFMATGWRPEDWQTWTPVGPGAKRGAQLVRDGFLLGSFSEHEGLCVCRELYDQRHEEWPEYLWPDHSTRIKNEVELDLTDIQFQLCEFSKYFRAKYQDKRPKRYFRPTVDEITRGTEK